MFTLYGAAFRRRTEPPWIAEQHAGLDGSTFEIIHEISNILFNIAKTSQRAVRRPRFCGPDPRHCILPILASGVIFVYLSVYDAIHIGLLESSTHHRLES
jgi:hypothetical protein